MEIRLPKALENVILFMYKNILLPFSKMFSHFGKWDFETPYLGKCPGYFPDKSCCSSIGVLEKVQLIDTF